MKGNKGAREKSGGVEYYHKWRGLFSIDKEVLKTPSKEVEDWKENAISFIADFEGFQECSYWDFKQWSIGYGTASRQGECITREEALKRKKEHSNHIFDIVDLDCYNDNQKIAMTSYIYNTGGYQLGLRGIIQRCDTNGVLYVMNNWGWTANGKSLDGLSKRRNLEIARYNLQ